MPALAQHARVHGRLGRRLPPSRLRHRHASSRSPAGAPPRPQPCDRPLRDPADRRRRRLDGPPPGAPASPGPVAPRRRHLPDGVRAPGVRHHLGDDPGRARQRDVRALDGRLPQPLPVLSRRLQRRGGPRDAVPHARPDAPPDAQALPCFGAVRMTLLRAGGGHLLYLAFFVWTLFPVAWLLLTSLKTRLAAFRLPP